MIWLVDTADAESPDGSVGGVVSGGGTTVIVVDIGPVVPPTPVQESEYVVVVGGVTDCEPDVGCDPLHPPDAVHDVAPDDDHVSVDELP